MERVKVIKSGYEPFLPKGVYKVVDTYRKQPIVVGRDGHRLRLNKKELYIKIKYI